MPSRLFLAIAVLCVIALTGGRARAQEPAEELRALEAQLAQALTRDDVAVFERLLADDFVLRGAPDVGRAAWIENAVDLCWGDSFTIDDFAVRRATADAAIVSLIVTTLVDPVTCEPAIVRSLLTDVWERDTDGRWRLSLRHSGPAGDSVAQQFTRADPPPPLWERAAELSLVSTGGNTDTRTLGVAGSVTWRPSQWMTRARVAYTRSAADGVETAEALSADVRQSHTLAPRLEARAGVAYLVDRFAGIDTRVTADGGVGWRAVDAAPHTLSLDVSAGVTHESRLDGTVLDFPIGSLDAHYRWRLSRTSELSEQAVFNADLGDAGNWRLRNLLNVTVSFTRVLSFKLGHELRRNNRPVPGFRATDTLLSAALVATF